MGIMNGTQYLLEKCGVRRYIWRDAPPDVALCYERWTDAPQFCQLLTGAGFPDERVWQCIFNALGVSGHLALLADRDPSGLCLSFLLLTLDHAKRDTLNATLMSALRAEFPLHELAEKLSELKL